MKLGPDLNRLAQDVGKSVGHFVSQMRQRLVSNAEARADGSAPHPESRHPTPSSPVHLADTVPVHMPIALQDGLAIVGYLCSEIGLGQAARGLAYACDASRLPVSFCDLPLEGRSNDTEFKSKCNRISDRKANLLVAGLPSIVELQNEIRGGRINILYPFWELSRIPPEWLASAERYDEIWAPSRFIAEAFGEWTKRPVRLVHQPLRSSPVAPRPTVGATSTLKLLSFLDFDSYVTRKNPAAAVRAFQLAFPASRSDVELVIKTRGTLDHGWRNRLAEVAAKDRRIRIVDRTVDRGEMDRLIDACDAFVSLHRSEGFGLGPAEAILAGKPVVATDYGGTRDFVTSATGYPVDFDLVPLKEGEYIGWEGQSWADPRIEVAAVALKSIYDDPEMARKRALQGYELLRKQHGLASVGKVIADRLSELGVLQSR